MGRPPTILRDQLLSVARTVFARKGFATATLADIASELNVTPAAVLRHAGSKQKLFVEAMQTTIVDLPPFIAALDSAAADADPRQVLRSFAEAFLPFAERGMAAHIAVYMHSSAVPLVLPFDPASPDSPPKRGLAALERYFKRAARAGTVHVRDPRAAALLFAGQLQSYVFLHHVLKVAPEPHPIDRYLDQLLALWSDGVITSRPPVSRATGPKGGPRARKSK